VPEPVFTSDPPAPLIAPPKAVEVPFPPVVSELAPSITEIGIDLEGGLVFSFRVSGAPRIGERPAQFVMGHIIVRANRQAIAVKRYRLLPICRLLRFVKIVAKSAVAILLFLVLNLLPGGESFQFFALARDLLFLLPDLPRLSL